MCRSNENGRSTGQELMSVCLEAANTCYSSVYSLQKQRPTLGVHSHAVAVIRRWPFQRAHVHLLWTVVCMTYARLVTRSLGHQQLPGTLVISIMLLKLL